MFYSSPIWNIHSLNMSGKKVVGANRTAKAKVKRTFAKPKMSHGHHAVAKRSGAKVVVKASSKMTARKAAVKRALVKKAVAKKAPALQKRDAKNALKKKMAA